jgi:cation:H+ antiporter
MILQISIFIVSCFILSWLSKSLIQTLVDIAKYLKWREFMIGFFVMSLATSLPNLFVDINAVFHNLPHLAFGDVIGGNLVDLTIVMGLAVLLGKKSLQTESNMVQSSAIFTGVIAVLPLLLISDGNLNRIDGVILLLTFLVYTFWIFSKQERFKKVYDAGKKRKKTVVLDFKHFVKNIFKLIVLLGLLLASSFVIIDSAQFFSSSLGASLSIVGILIIGLGNSFPELYFAIISSRRGEGWMILGNLMGSVIVCSTLVLGIIALISPFEINDFSPFLIARAFTILAAIFYIYVIRSGKQITKKEGLLLIFVYMFFLITEIFFK